VNAQIPYDQAAMLALHNSFSLFPNKCSVGATIRAGAGGRASAGFNYDSSKGVSPSGSIALAQVSGQGGGGQVGISARGSSVAGTVSASIPDTPFSLGVSMKGNLVAGIQLGVTMGKYFSAQVNASIGSMYQCKP
jgi:hypothetical protein